jgi:hypothetical protein
MLENKVQNLNDKKLYSLLFLIEYNHLETCGVKMFDETFVKNSRNPDPKTLAELFDIIANGEDLEEDDERLYIIQELLDHIDIEILKKEKYIELKFLKMEEGFDSSLFTKDEFKTLDKIVNKYCNETSRKLANVCFGIEKVRQTTNGETII